MKQGTVHIGTSGWSYGTWKGAFYPDKLKSTDYLRHYAQIFSCTEINSSFYHLPRNTTTEGWIQKVPDTFLFCAKMSRYVTHIKRLNEPEEPLSRFFIPFESIKSHLGPILIQLPPSLKFDYETVEYLYTLLNAQYGTYQFAIEGRHESWLTEESFKLMREHKMGFVISQSGVGFPYAEEVTSSFAYLRFHGPGELFKSSYSKEMLDDYAKKIIAWRKKGYNVWVFFNNTWYTDAIENARYLIEMVK